MTIEQQLDRILEILYARRFDHLNKTDLPIQHLCDQLPFKNKNLEHEELCELFDILSDDGFVLLKKEEKEKISKIKKSQITLKGAYFINNGGYKVKTRFEHEEKTRLVSLEKKTYNATFWMAFGAIALVVIEILKSVVENYIYTAVLINPLSVFN